MSDDVDAANRIDPIEDEYDEDDFDEIAPEGNRVLGARAVAHATDAAVCPESGGPDRSAVAVAVVVASVRRSGA